MSRSDGTQVAAAETMSAQLAQGWRWIRCGIAELRRDPPLWIGMAIVYLVPAVIVARIPFAGPLIVMLISPMLLAGALLAAEEVKATSPGQAPAEQWLIRPGRALLGAIVDDKRVYPTVLLGIVTLGLVVLTFIVEHLFGLGSLRNVLTSSARHAAPLWSIALGLIGATILHVLLIMGLLYAAHRTMLGRRDPMTGIVDSFGACTRQPFALLAMAGPFAILYLLIVSVFSVSDWLGYFLLLTTGIFALPAFVAATLCSYHEMFPESVGR